jgi:F420-dependent oxidoreductase-like protein
MRVCLMIEGQENVTWDQWVALALACEEHGFDALFRSDHYASFNHELEWGALDAWATLSALAARTERIRLGTLVSPVTFRHPSEVAKSVVTADYVSNGRVELGLGAGWFEREHRMYGFPFPPSSERFGILEEQIEIVHRQWSKDEPPLTFEGKHYRLERCPGLPKPLQDPHPPLILGGGGGPRSLALGARWADEYNVNMADPEKCRQHRRHLDEACERGERDPESLPLSLMTMTLVASDQAELEYQTARLMSRQGWSGEPRSYMEEVGPERTVGTVDQVVEQLTRFAEAGVRRVMLQHLVHDDLESVALIGREIIPRVAAL